MEPTPNNNNDVCSYIESSCPLAITINRTRTRTLHIHNPTYIRVMYIRVDPI